MAPDLLEACTHSPHMGAALSVEVVPGLQCRPCWHCSQALPLPALRSVGPPSVSAGLSHKLAGPAGTVPLDAMQMTTAAMRTLKSVGPC